MNSRLKDNNRSASADDVRLVPKTQVRQSPHEHKEYDQDAPVSPLYTVCVEDRQDSIQKKIIIIKVDYAFLLPTR